MKKIKTLSFVLACILLLTACSAGGDSGKNDKTAVTLTLWHYYVSENLRAFEEAVTQFNETVGMENNVFIEAVAQGSIADLENAVTDSAKGVINSSEMPDIFSAYPDTVKDLDQLGVICELSPYFTQEEQQEYVQGFLEDGVFDENRLLIIPIVKSTEILCVNDTAWTEFCEGSGYSNENLKTWEGVYETARAYYNWLDEKTPGTAWDGKALMGFDSLANFIIIGAKQLGAEIMNAANSKANLDEKSLYKVFENYYMGMSLGYYDAVGNFRSDDIKAGNLIAYVGSTSSAAYFPTWIEQDNTQLPVELLALPYPTFEGGQQCAISQGAGMAVSKSDERRQEAAALFLKWFTDTQQNIPFAMSTGYLPVKTQAYDGTQLDDMIDEMRSGDKVESNVAKFYEISISQIIGGGAFSSKPFLGSYAIRPTLKSTLTDIAVNGRELADAMKAQGAGEDEIIEALNVEGRFDDWMSAIKSELQKNDVAW